MARTARQRRAADKKRFAGRSRGADNQNRARRYERAVKEYGPSTRVAIKQPKVADSAPNPSSELGITKNPFGVIGNARKKAGR